MERSAAMSQPEMPGLLYGEAENDLRQAVRAFFAERCRPADVLARTERGEAYDFPGFMQRYGDFFPENPKTLDELLEQMARRMTALSRLLASMSPEQRAELEALARQVLEEGRLIPQ